jgi:hypothetical protein
MDFRRAAARMTASGVDDSLDASMQDAGLPAGHGTDVQPPPQSDGMDPATPGGPAPYNGAEPFGQPVTTDPEWRDPRDWDTAKDEPMPHIEGPKQNALTLHGLRHKAYMARERIR